MHLLAIKAMSVPVVLVAGIEKQKACLCGFGKSDDAGAVSMVAQNMGGLARLGLIASWVGNMASVIGGTHCGCLCTVWHTSYFLSR